MEWNKISMIFDLMIGNNSGTNTKLKIANKLII